MSVLFDCQHRYRDGFQLGVQFLTQDPCTVIVGPSGSGKTSILSMIAGTIQPDSGHIEIGNQVVLDTKSGRHTPCELRGVGFVFQEPRLFPHLTVLENLRFGQRWRKHQAQEVALERVAQVLEITPLLHRVPELLSGGEKQRVAIGRALASGPKLLLMDEPMSSLDQGLKLRVLDYLRRVIDEWQIPVIYVTHSTAERELIADRTIWIEAGQWVPGPADSPPGDLSEASS